MDYFEKLPTFTRVTECPFGRRGSYFVFYAEPGSDVTYGRSKVNISTVHGNAILTNRKKLYNMYPLYKGERLPYAVTTTPTELIMNTMYGQVRICIAKPELILFKGENGLGLRLQVKEGTNVLVKPRGDRAWEILFPFLLGTVMNPIKGHIHADTKWDLDTLRSAWGKLDFLPDEEDGEFVGCLEEFSHAGFVRDNYPSYEEGLKIVKDDWENFLSHIKPLPEKYEPLRESAAYAVWSFFVNPAGYIKRPMLYMGRDFVASAWQFCHQALALNGDMALTMDLMNLAFDQQSETGQIPDFYDDGRGVFGQVRPPLQGWVLKWLDKRGRLDEVPLEVLEDYYPKLSKWADWFMKYRDDDHDGIPQYEHGDECGMEDTSTFRLSCVMETPDLSADLVLLYEALGDLAKRIGRPDAEAEEWYKKSKDLLDLMIRTFWDGERFISMVSGTHERPEHDYGILGYLPIVLGKRLPQEIIDKLAADLSVENDVLSPYGFDKERMYARDLSTVADEWVRGFIYPANNLLLVVGLHDAGKKELAKEAARRLCDEMLRTFGIGSRVNAFSGGTPSEWSSWNGGIYLTLARYAGGQMDDC